MPQQYDPTPLEGRTFSVTGTASGQALAFVIQPAKLAELATPESRGASRVGRGAV